MRLFALGLACTLLGLGACSSSSEPVTLEPAAFDEEGCLMYRVADGDLGAAVLYYRKKDGGRTLLASEAQCVTPEMVDMTEDEGGCRTFRLEAEGFVSQQMFYPAMGGGYTDKRSEAHCEK